ncbi:unnamed protein product, partial [marine sediment metagenome]
TSASTIDQSKQNIAAFKRDKYLPDARLERL